MSQLPSDWDAAVPGAPESLIERLGVAAFGCDLEGSVERPSAALRRLLRLPEPQSVELAELMPRGTWESARKALREEGFWRDEALELTVSSDQRILFSIALQPLDGVDAAVAGVIQKANEVDTRPAASAESERSPAKVLSGQAASRRERHLLLADAAAARSQAFAPDRLSGSARAAAHDAGAGEDSAGRGGDGDGEHLHRHVHPISTSAGSAPASRTEPAQSAPDNASLATPCAAEPPPFTEAERDQLHDPVTGLPNRLLLHDRLGRAMADRRGRGGSDYAVLLLGLDRFRVVNDGLGYESGNILLARVARRLEGVIRPMDTLARCGSDEFVLLLDSVEGGDDAVRASLRLKQALEAPFDIDGHQIFVTASIGITLGRASAGSPDNVLRQAAIALAKAKSCGRGSYQIFGSEMHEQAVTALKMEIDLRQALEDGEFRVVYQPMISLADRKLVGFEALVRWRNSSGVEVGPNDFIPLAEETGLIIALDRWVLAEACSRLAVWRTIPGCADLTVSVNLSTRELGLPDLVNQVARSLQIAGLDPSALKLEITESAVMENPTAAMRVLEQIRGLGVKLQLDDFGTGYSSLSQLHNLPIDALKIDRSFVRGMHDDRGGLFIETIVVLAQHLGLAVVAEGIETQDQLHGVEALGCELAQGFLISRPLETEAALELLLNPEAMHQTRWADHRMPLEDEDDTQLILVPRAPLREALRSSGGEGSGGIGGEREGGARMPEGRMASM